MAPTVRDPVVRTIPIRFNTQLDPVPWSSSVMAMASSSSSMKVDPDDDDQSPLSSEQSPVSLQQQQQQQPPPESLLYLVQQPLRSADRPPLMGGDVGVGGGPLASHASPPPHPQVQIQVKPRNRVLELELPLPTESALYDRARGDLYGRALQQYHHQQHPLGGGASGASGTSDDLDDGSQPSPLHRRPLPSHSSHSHSHSQAQPLASMTLASQSVADPAEYRIAMFERGRAGCRWSGMAGMAGIDLE